jgi:hypothetical protein
MIIYNVTTNIDNDVHDEWFQWMKTVHIPEMMNTGYFLEYKMCKVLIEEEQGTTYSVQFTCANMEDLNDYKNEHSTRLQKEAATKYGSKAVSFRTLLEVV